MLQPKRVKFRKTHKGRRRGNTSSASRVVFGDFGLQAKEAVWLTARQIEAARRAITRHVRRGGNIWVCVYPDKPVTKKAAETRMGSGKGAPDHWVAVVKPGTGIVLNSITLLRIEIRILFHGTDSRSRKQ